MNFTNTIRRYWAALRALLVFTVICGFGYPLLIWLVAFIPGLHDKAEGSILTANGNPIGSKLIGQSFTDASGNPLPQYFQSRPSAAGSNGYDPTASGGSSLGPESVVDTPADPAKLAGGSSPADAGFKASLLTLVCSRSAATVSYTHLDVYKRQVVHGSLTLTTLVGWMTPASGARGSRGPTTASTDPTPPPVQNGRDPSTLSS